MKRLTPILVTFVLFAIGTFLLRNSDALIDLRLALQLAMAAGFGAVAVRLYRAGVYHESHLGADVVWVLIGLSLSHALLSALAIATRNNTAVTWAIWTWTDILEFVCGSALVWRILGQPIIVWIAGDGPAVIEID